MKILFLLLIIILHSSIAFTQEVYNLKITPAQPKAGQFVTLEFGISGANSQNQISVEFITWSDIDGNQELSSAGEKHTFLSLQDNAKGDLDPAKNYVKLNLLKVPVKNAPLKYTAVVKIGRSAQSSSLDVVPANLQAAPTLTAKPHSIAVLNRFQSLFNTILLSLRGGSDTSLVGPAYHKIFRYDVSSQKVETINVDSGASVFSPSISPNNSNIAFISVVKTKSELNLFDMVHQKQEKLDSSNDLKTPHWLNDNTILLYVKDNQLTLIDIQNRKLTPVSPDTYVDRIINCAQDRLGNTNLIVRSKDPIVPGRFELYLMVLNGTGELIKNTMIANNPALYYVYALNPLNGVLAVDETRKDQNNHTIYKIVLHDIKQNGQNQEIVLFEDAYNYRDASWSPDGKYLLFVSTRPQ